MIQSLVIFVVVAAYLGIATYYFNRADKYVSENEKLLKEKVIKLRDQYEKLEALSISLRENPQKEIDPAMLRAVDIATPKIIPAGKPTNIDDPHNKIQIYKPIPTQEVVNNNPIRELGFTIWYAIVTL